MLSVKTAKNDMSLDISVGPVIGVLMLGYYSLQNGIQPHLRSSESCCFLGLESQIKMWLFYSK